MYEAVEVQGDEANKVRVLLFWSERSKNSGIFLNNNASGVCNSLAFSPEMEVLTRFASEMYYVYDYF